MCSQRARRIAFAIAGGIFLLGACNVPAAPPIVSVVNPPGTALVNAGDSVYLRADASDSDGQITRVEFYTNGVLHAEATTAPYGVWWTNVFMTVHHITAVATDDAMERGTSAVRMVTGLPPASRTLDWVSDTIPSLPYEWNTRDFRWRWNGGYALFHPGDTVRLYSWSPVFIGVDGVRAPVAPGGIIGGYAAWLDGGDILTGSLDVTGTTVMSNSAASFSYPGGTIVRQSGNLTYSVARAPSGATVRLGTGPITMLDGRFSLDLDTNQFATIENDLTIENTQTSPTMAFRIGGYNRANATARFTGSLNVSGRFGIEIQNGVRQFFPEGMRDPDYHEFAGPVTISQSRRIDTGFYFWGSYRSKGVLLSGNIKDGGGAFTNRLGLQTYGVPVIRLTGSNTYAHGTLVDYSPSAPQGWVEVAPESSLGFGGVEVRGKLRLMGNRNIHSNAWLNVMGGRVILDSGVKVRLSRFSSSGINHTVGLFTQTNSQNSIMSNGTVRLPAINLQPTVAITNPVNGVIVGRDALQVNTLVRDLDSYIDRVELYLDGSLRQVRTNAPFTFSLTNAPVGRHTLRATVYDDDGGVATSAPVEVTVAPQIDRITLVETNVVVLEFRSAATGLILQTADSLTTPVWTDLEAFGPPPTAATYFVTNAIPPGTPLRVYRLQAPE